MTLQLPTSFEYLKHIYHRYRRSLKKNPKKRLKLVLASIFLTFFVTYCFIEFAQALFVFNYPRWAIEFDNSATMSKQKQNIPKFGVCPGFLLNETASQGSTPIWKSKEPGRIDSIKCAFIGVDSQGTSHMKRDQLSVVSSVKRIERKEFNCFDVNANEDDRPLVEYSNIDDYMFCEVVSDTFVRISPDDGLNVITPLNQWDRWRNIEHNAGVVLTIGRIEMTYASGKIQDPYFEIIKLEKEITYDDKKITTFRVKFAYLSDKLYREYYPVNLIAMFGMFGGIGTIVYFVFSCFVGIFGSMFTYMSGRDTSKDDYTLRTYEDEEREQSENQSISSEQGVGYADRTIQPKEYYTEL